MVSRIYLALYKGNRSGTGFKVLKSRLGDWLTRKVTKGIYSHCELALLQEYGQYLCYSSSIRDGGVRQKLMPLPAEKWDLIPLNLSNEQIHQVDAFFIRNRGKKYDWLGAIGVVLKFNQDKNKYFCSEFCAEALGLSEPWRFSPNDLSAILKRDI